MKNLIFLFLLFMTMRTAAEYRAFVLLIEKINVDPNAEPEYRLALSNLDPLQYGAYYNLAMNEKISYLDTWMCFNRTNEKAICPNPKGDMNYQEMVQKYYQEHKKWSKLKQKHEITN